MKDPEPFAAIAAKEPLHEKRQESAVRAKRRRPLLMIGAVCVLVILFGRPLAFLCIKAISSEFHSYILLVPFIFAYLLFSRKKELPEEYAGCISPRNASVFPGFGAVVTAILAARANAIGADIALSLMILSFVCFTVGTGFLLLGKSWLGAAAFPFFFLIFLIPMPDVVIEHTGDCFTACFRLGALIFSSSWGNALHS